MVIIRTIEISGVSHKERRETVSDIRVVVRLGLSEEFVSCLVSKSAGMEVVLRNFFAMLQFAEDECHRFYPSDRFIGEIISSMVERATYGMKIRILVLRVSDFRVEFRHLVGYVETERKRANEP